jgi:hypothetical protein
MAAMLVTVLPYIYHKRTLDKAALLVADSNITLDSSSSHLKGSRAVDHRGMLNVLLDHREDVDRLVAGDLGRKGCGAQGKKCDEREAHSCNIVKVFVKRRL